MGRNLPLTLALDAERVELDGRAGRSSYYVAGSGPPVLMLHSINAAGSAFEMRPIFERLLGAYEVYAPDLPGFGFSDRSRRSYDLALYANALEDILDAIARRAGETPVIGIALSLAAEFLARAVNEHHDRFERLVLINPTGFSRGSGKYRGPAMSSREITGFYTVFSFPLWGRGLYDLLTSRRSIRYFLQRTWGSKDVDESMVEYDYLTSHQPGAENAPFAFLAGKLFSRDVRTLFEGLELPVWVPHGTRGDFKDFSDTSWAEAKPNWTFTAFETGALPHFEAPGAFFEGLDSFLKKSRAEGK